MYLASLIIIQVHEFLANWTHPIVQKKETRIFPEIFSLQLEVEQLRPEKLTSAKVEKLILGFPHH